MKSLAAFFITFSIILALAQIHEASAKADDVWVLMTRCQTEDGSDVDGVCVWVDPDTGDGYINNTGGTE